jgi:hypothetical protein
MVGLPFVDPVFASENGIVNEDLNTDLVGGPMQWVTRYLEYRKGRESLEAVEGQAKKNLLRFLAEECQADDKGNSVFQLPSPIGEVSAIKRERRLSQRLDEDAALKAIEEFGLSECLETVLVVNEDALLAANYAGRLPDDVVAGLYSEKESFAFVLVKSKGR